MSTKLIILTFETCFHYFFFYFYFVMLLYLTKPLSYYRKVLNIRHKHNCFIYIDKKNVIHFVNQ